MLDDRADARGGWNRAVPEHFEFREETMGVGEAKDLHTVEAGELAHEYEHARRQIQGQ